MFTENVIKKKVWNGLHINHTNLTHFNYSTESVIISKTVVPTKFIYRILSDLDTLCSAVVISKVCMVWIIGYINAHSDRHKLKSLSNWKRYFCVTIWNIFTGYVVCRWACVDNVFSIEHSKNHLKRIIKKLWEKTFLFVEKFVNLLKFSNISFQMKRHINATI